MKKTASLFLLLLVLISCTTDVTRNDPAFQGLKDDVQWRAKTSYAQLAANQSITIIGITQYETVTLNVQNKTEGTYVLGAGNINKASYLYSHNGDELFYATGPGMGDGQIVITHYDPVQLTISGTFRFNAVNVDNNPSGGPLLNFQYGVFYKVPVVPAL